MLCAMYFAQGVPWGFMTIALVSHLTARGVGDTAAGNLTAIVLVPWTFKLIWGPIIDTMTIRSMGRRRPWIIGAELMMAVSLLGLLMMGDLTDNLWLLGWMFFIHNCFASLQDVATDALAVDILPRGEQGRTNGMMWGSKLIGKAMGASVMALAIAKWGLSSAVIIQFVVLIIIMLFPLLMLERPGEKRFPWSRGEANFRGSDAGGMRHPFDVFRDLFQAFSLATTSFFLIYGLIHTIGWGIVEVITKTLYTQQLDWTAEQVSYVSGLAVFTEMAGAFGGGYVADRFGRRKVMVIGFMAYGLAAIIFGCCPHLWNQRWFAAGYLLVNPGLLAIGSVGFLSMGMRISWTTASATVFTIYMTVSNVAHVMGNKAVGPLRDGLGLSYEHTFWVAGISMFVPLLLLLFVRPEQVDRMRDAELKAILDTSGSSSASDIGMPES
ncbi:MAG TPA: MFS transporter [Pirellulaceae bacterium]|nr:MFS transporter [Pirellulaceae bacterium]